MKAWRRLAFCLSAIVASFLPSAKESRATAITIGSYYEEGSNRESHSPPATGQCTTNVCYWMFNVIPAGKQLVVTDISCRIHVHQDVANALLHFSLVAHTDGALSDRSQLFVPDRQVSNGTNIIFIFRATTTKLFRAGDRPLIVATSTLSNGNPSWLGNCTIAGKIGNPPD